MAVLHRRRRGLFRALGNYFSSAHFQLGAQLAVCLALVSLPTFVGALSFKHGCFSSVLMTICLISMSPDGHVGTKVLAAASMIGESWLACGLAGVMVSLAKPLQEADGSARSYLAVLSITASAGLAVLAVPRAGPQPLTLWPNITVASLIYAAVVLFGQYTLPVSRFWAENVTGILLSGLLAALAVIVASTLVLPSLAGDEAVRLTCTSVRGAGHSMSRYLSLLLDTAPDGGTDDTGEAEAAAAAAAAAADAADAALGTTVEPESGEGLGHASVAADSVIYEGLKRISLQSMALLGVGRVNTSLTAAGMARPRLGARGSFVPAAGDVVLDMPEEMSEKSEHHMLRRSNSSSSSASSGSSSPSSSTASRRSSSQGRLGEQAVGATPDPQQPAGQDSDQTQLQQPGQEHNPPGSPTGGKRQRRSSKGAVLYLLRFLHHRQSARGHAAVLPGPKGPLEVMGPSVDELRPLLTRARVCLQRAVFEPTWLNHGHCSLGSSGGSSCWQQGGLAVRDLPAWREVLAAAEQLLNMVSALEDVLVQTSSRLVNPVLHSTSSGFASAAATVICTAITTCAQLAQALSQSHGSSSSSHSSSSSGGRRPGQQQPQAASSAGGGVADVAAQRSGSSVARQQRRQLQKLPSFLQFKGDRCWEAARAELQAATEVAMQRYFQGVLHSRHGAKVAHSSEALAIMFVFVLMSGVLDSAERLDVAGSKLLLAAAPSCVPGGDTSRDSGHSHSSDGSMDCGSSGKDAQDVAAPVRPVTPVQAAAFIRPAQTPGGSSSNSRPAQGRRGQLKQKQKQQQQQQKRESWQAQWAGSSLQAMVDAALQLPLLSNLAASCRNAIYGAGLVIRQAAAPAAFSCCGRSSSQVPQQSAAPQQQQQQGCRNPLRVLRTNRSVAAAFKFWLAMSALLMLALVVAGDPGHAIWPQVAAAVKQVPTHGMIAMVLVWHERVESTVIRMVLRILGTALGAAIGFAAMSVPAIASSPPLLLLVLAAFGLLLAPLASPSFHLRLATALTVISMCVVVLCQYDVVLGPRASVAYFITRILEVTVACIIAALCNNLVLPWTSTDWCLENMAACCLSASSLLQDTCRLQFAAGQVTAELPEPAAAERGPAAPPPAKLQHQQEQQRQQLSGLRQALQARLVAPLVGVQTSLVLEVQVWQQRQPRLVAATVLQLLRAMLDLSDRLTAVQVVVASCQQQQQQQQQLQDAASVAAAAGAESSSSAQGQGSSIAGVAHLATRMLPLHQRQALLLDTLLPPLAAAVKCHLLQPSAASRQDLQQQLQALQGEWQGSKEAFSLLRRQLHAEMRQQARPHQAPAAAAADHHNVHHQEHAVLQWWAHAGYAYMQLLAFQFAFDGAVSQLLVVAELALELHQA